MTSREIALTASLRAAGRGAPLQDVLCDMLDDSGLDGRDRAFAEEIALGALRRRISLDLVLDRVLTSPIGRVQPPVAEALRQAAYQILILDRVPSHAAVNETVTLVKAQMGKGPAGLANAVLRSLSRLVVAKGAKRPGGARSRSAIASRDGAFTTLTKRIVPGVDENPTRWLAGAYGYPAWLVERWLDRFGAEQTERVLEWGNTPPGLTVRLNPLRLPDWPLREEDAARAFEGCASYAPGEVPGTYALVAEAHPRGLGGLKAGLFTVQDSAQVRPCRVLNPPPGARVLDLCAGLGGKSTQLAEMVGPDGGVVALELDERKIELARAADERLGLANISHVCGDVTDAPGDAAGGFEFVLLDAPCSNIGSLDRRPEVRHRVTERAINELAEAELGLLRAALARVAEGGTMVYSVCTLEPEETDLVVTRALEERSEFRLESEHYVTPVAGARDGGYCARITRSRSRTD